MRVGACIGLTRTEPVAALKEVVRATCPVRHAPTCITNGRTCPGGARRRSRAPRPGCSGHGSVDYPACLLVDGAMVEDAGATVTSQPPQETSVGFDVFLSHNSADKPAVFEIARALRAAGVSPFLDAWHLVPGEPWQEAVEDALDASRACAVFVGPNGIGTWENEEMRAALSRHAADPEFRVIPVILPAGALPERGQAAALPLAPDLGRLPSRDLTIPRRSTGSSRESAALPRGSTTPTRPRSIVCPFRGLGVFGEEHAEFFHGREALVQELVEHLREDRFLAVLGPSGSGKSSVVRAGLIPALRRGALQGSATWDVQVFRPGVDPDGALAAALESALGPDRATTVVSDATSNLERSERALHARVSRAYQRAPVDARLLIVVDQFEELFTLGLTTSVPRRIRRAACCMPRRSPAVRRSSC